MPLVLPALPAVAAGIMALILIFGVILLIDALLRAIDIANVPGIISGIFRAIVGAIHYAATVIGNFLAAVARPAVAVFVSPARGFVNVIDSTVVAFARLGSWVRWLVHDAVPSLWNGIFSAIANAVANLTSLIYRIQAQLAAALATVQHALEGLIGAVRLSLISYAQALHRLAMATLTSAIASVSAYALSLTRAAIDAFTRRLSDLTHYVLDIRAQLAAYAYELAQWAVHTATGISIDWAKKYADQLIDLYNKAIAGGTAIALAPAWPTALDAIDAISLALPESIAAVLARIGAFPRAIPRDIAAEIGAVAAVSTVAIDWVARCGLDLCRNAKGFGNDLAALEDAALLAAIFELVVEGVADPRGAANAIVDDIAEPLGSVVREFADMIGL